MAVAIRQPPPSGLDSSIGTLITISSSVFSVTPDNASVANIFSWLSPEPVKFKVMNEIFSLEFIL